MPKEIHELGAFHVVVLRVIEFFVHNDIAETISLAKMAQMINTNPLLILLRGQIEDNTGVKTQEVTIQNVIRAIMEVFHGSQLNIMENKDNFRLKLDRPGFQGLITKVYDEYRDDIVKLIQDDEVELNKLDEEIKAIESGELDGVIIGENDDTDPETVPQSRESSKRPLSDDEAPSKRQKKTLIPVATSLISSITSHKYANMFMTPVSEVIAPDYYTVIKHPRDLKTIKAMVKDGRIIDTKQLEREVLLMFANSIMYNRTDTEVHEWAKEMQQDTDKLIDLLVKDKKTQPLREVQ